MRRRKLTRWHARGILAWLAVAFLGTQFALARVLDTWRPEANDPEFEIRLALLKQRRAESPERPFLLVVGSSRLVTAFRPEILEPLPGEAPLVFNFSHYGAGPLVSLVELQRLYRHGIRPRWLVLEITPPFLTREGPSLATTIMCTRDLPTLHRYFAADKVYPRYLRQQLLPCCRYRSELTGLLTSTTTLPTGDASEFCFDPLGGNHVHAFEHGVSPEVLHHLHEVAESQYGPMLATFDVRPEGEEALREAIGLARQHGTNVALLVMPESSRFRGWYEPHANERLARLYRDLADDFQVPVIDARAWVPDEDFVDGHHLFGAAAERFTRRLAAEVLVPFVSDRLGTGVFASSAHSAPLAQP